MAVKTLRPDIDFEASGEQFSERFFREASLAGSLSHPNIVTVHDYGQDDDGTCFIVMELVEGTSLKELMRAGPIDAERALDLFCQLARGLRHAHRAGLVHRDVKPGNVQLTPGDDGREVAKLLDFGLVKSDLPEVTEITREGSFLGTPHYASPEQVRGREADARSDLYALGVMLYRALCGRLPYYSRNSMTMAMSHVTDPYPPMSKRAPDVPVAPSHEAIVQRLMAKDPDDRYPDAASLLVDLEAAYVSVRAAAGRGVPPIELTEDLRAMLSAPTTRLEDEGEDGAEPASEPRRESRGAIWLGLVAAGLFAVGVTGWLVAPTVWGPDEISLEGSVSEVEPAQAPTQSGDWSAQVLEASAPLSLQVALASEPSGASVVVDGETLGQTPWVGTLAVDEGAHAPMTLQLDGYLPREVELDVGDGTASSTVVLKRIPVKVKKPAKAPPRPQAARRAKAKSSAAPKPPPAAPKPSTSSASYDGVSFTAQQATATLRFANNADKSAFNGAGIRTQEFNKVAAGRPHASMSDLSNSPGVGPKTLTRMRDAAR